MAARYALYWAPDPHSALWRFGCAWLGRDAARGEKCAHPEAPGLDPDWLHAITSTPRRYGFHATLKNPFELAEGVEKEDLFTAFDEFVARQKAITTPPLELAALRGFLALRLAEACPALDDLAAKVVERFHEFAGPPASQELMHYRSLGLSISQIRNLETWGYPFVMEDFVFHLTLTNRLDGGTLLRAEKAANPLVAPFLGKGLAIEALCIFVQDEPRTPFRIVRRVGLAAD